MLYTERLSRLTLSCLLLLCGLFAATAIAADDAPHWEPCGWGGGGWYWATAFHPAKDGVIYLGLDVGGVAKTTDHGMSWRITNSGLTAYGVYSLAVDRASPDTVYAITDGGLHKSTDAGEHWQFLPKTGPKDLRITAERSKSVRSLAVDPGNSNNLYAASPGGNVYKSIDAGQTWTIAWSKSADRPALRVQFGKNNAEYFGGIWMPLEFPAGAKGEPVGIALTFKGGALAPREAFLTLRTSTGGTYRTSNIRAIFSNQQWSDVVYRAADFTIDPQFAKQELEKAKTLPATPDWATVNRIDLTCVGSLPEEAYIANLAKVSFAFANPADGQPAPAGQPTLLAARDFTADKTLQSYGNIRVLGDAAAGTVYAVAVSAKDPSLVVAATETSGLIFSEDAGKTWRELQTPKKASSAAFADTDPRIMYASFFEEGIYKSTDKGNTWSRASEGLSSDNERPSVLEVVVSPTNPLDVYCIGPRIYCSQDGGESWKRFAVITTDLEGNPTRHFNGEKPTTDVVNPRNIAINPLNAKELFVAADWRSVWSGDAGLTCHERERGADISCITDIRFSNGRAYATAMDEGVLVSEDNGRKWRQLWPATYIAEVSGHAWRVAVSNVNGVDHIVSTMSPWNITPKTNIAVVSHDGGKTNKVIKAGLPDYELKINTMWERGYMRALATDPNNPMVLYAGIDGNAESGKIGGGVFRSADGGLTWAQLPNQPGSRRMFNGLAVDPTDSQRIYLGTCGENGGVWMSADGGATWKNPLPAQWIWNLLVTKEGVIYAAAANLWRSDDHGQTWKQLTNFTGGGNVLGLEVDPRNSRTLWITTVKWALGNDGCGVWKTTDEGATWQDITGDLPYTKPQVLRFNPATNELWAGWVGLYKLKQ